MAERPPFAAGPLSRDDAEQIEATLLPNLDRHHLRLLTTAYAASKPSQILVGQAHSQTEARSSNGYWNSHNWLMSLNSAIYSSVNF